NSGDNTVKVNMNNNIRCEFGPENADTTYQKNVIPEATVTGMLINEVVYAVSRDSDRPTDGYAALLPINADGDKMEYTYELPALTGADGVWYIHILATGNTGDAQYFRGVYLLDRTVPELHFNSLGLAEDGTSVNALIEIHDALSGESGTAYYQILRGKTSPASDSEDWIEIPADGKITITGEPATYYIHVKASDLAGNEVIGVSAPFEVKEADPEPMVLPPYGCQLLTVEDGFGIANLLLETENKEDYRYSISTDGGQKWCNWLPYMSMIRIALPDDYMQPDLLQVKFRAPDGNVGVPRSLATGEMIEDAIYMTAEFDSTFKRQSGNDLTLIMALPDEVEYTLEGADDWRTGNFTVAENGAYSFEMRKGTTSAATEFTVVVDIFDDVAPTARLTYSEIAPTASGVLVNVVADEPVFVRSVTVQPEGEAEFSASPKMQYAFEKNGTASFAISDEAGNITTLTATVGNIDKTPPRVKITENYDRYRVNGDFASGVTLVVEKESADDENFVVIGEKPTNKIEVTENGTYSFTVRDAVGNVTAVSKAVTNIVTALPSYTLTSTYAQSGEPVDTSAPQKEDVTVRATFEQITDGRKLYFGTAPAADGSNELAKDGNGRYFATRTYTQNGNTLMVVSDDLGNNRRIPVTVSGIDKKAPTFKLQVEQAIIQPTDKKLSKLSAGEILEMFGGYTVSDNAYAPGDIVVKVSRSDDIIKTAENRGDLSTPGVYTLIYTATDPAGNTARAEQSLVVIPGDGLLVQASGVVLSSAMSNTAIVPSNHVTFAVNPQRMQAMFYGTARQKVYNRAMRYDVYYVSGLYREGQLKTIAQKLTAEELLAKNFEVTFPKAGWYTIIIRNQERAREYTTFFVASYEK
ncbi:MAG: hypothetical protein IJT56_00770, partial [Clostridia bacterium]|nr:hypothetical protein [Clostridia bacterium]